MRSPLVASVLLFAGIAGGQDASPAARREAEIHLAQGRTLIQANCGDCYDPNRDALERGLAEIQAALDLGLETAEAHRLRACAFQTITFEFAAVGPERISFWKMELSALRRAAELDRTDIASRVRVAQIAKEEAEREAAWESVLAIDPDHALALFASGEALIRRGDKEKGLARVERASEVADGRDAAMLRHGIEEVLRENGRAQRALEIKGILDAKAAKVGR